MEEMTNMYQRIRTLALQSANGTNSQDDRNALQQEVESLCAEIDRITTDTTFAGETIFDKTSISFQVGADANQQISLSMQGSTKSYLNKVNGTGTASNLGGWTVKDLYTVIGNSSATINGTKDAARPGDTGEIPSPESPLIFPMSTRLRMCWLPLIRT